MVAFLRWARTACGHRSGIEACARDAAAIGAEGGPPRRSTKSHASCCRASASPSTPVPLAGRTVFVATTARDGGTQFATRWAQDRSASFSRCRWRHWRRHHRSRPVAAAVACQAAPYAVPRRPSASRLTRAAPPPSSTAPSPDWGVPQSRRGCWDAPRPVSRSRGQRGPRASDGFATVTSPCRTWWCENGTSASPRWQGRQRRSGRVPSIGVSCGRRNARPSGDPPSMQAGLSGV
jgi:hypothetical protein